jgi:hypothetical protein
MTVKQLKEMLAELSSEMDECQVIMSCDAEGNHYSPMADLDDGCYCDDSKKYWIDSVYFDVHGWEGNGFTSEREWEGYKKESNRVIVLWPTN